MRITFDPDFDGGYWPGPLYRTDPLRVATVGEAWVGPFLLQKMLETALGLGGLVPSTAERIISLSKTISAQEGFWSTSAKKDPIGSARTLLRWIDWLKLHGWQGQAPPASARAPRLADLAKIAPSIPPGPPDYLNAIIAALDKRHPDIELIETFEPIERLSPIWQTIFAKLKARGVKIIELSPALAASSGAAGSAGTNPGSFSRRKSELKAAKPDKKANALPADSDLRRALLPGFTPIGDGSLLLFRPYNPLDAAEQLAVWLASHPAASSSSAAHPSASPPPPPDTIIITPDAALDEALRRFGLPVTGAREATSDDPLLQVLLLVLSMGWNPPDPQRALELLLLPESPIPGFIARDLRNALREWPSVNSPDWLEALKHGLDEVHEPARRESIRERISAVFTPDAASPAPSSSHSPTIPADALKRRARLVKLWAAAQRNATPAPAPDLADRLDAVLAQCASFESLIDLSGFDALTEPQLLKLNMEISGSIRPGGRYVPQAGFTSVPSPASIAGPARRIVWWDFTLESAPQPFSLPLSRFELAALASHNIHLTPASDLASDEARRRRRPFDLASETLILVCPKFGDDGEERHHHPLWDEVAASKSKTANLSLLQVPRLDPARPFPTRTEPLLPVPTPRRAWAVAPGLIMPPARLSPTALQELIGCPFKWTLSRLGSLRDPESAVIADTANLMGKLSHEILAEVLRAAPADGAAARALAERLFDDLGPRLAAPLFLPGAPVELAFSRKATSDAAGRLVDLLDKAGLPVIDVEFEVAGATGRFDLGGRLDLAAGKPGDPAAPPVVIDLKWSGETFRRDQLKNGTATQLAAYAFLIKSGAKFPPVAYFIIRNGHMIARKDAPFAGVETVDGPPLEKTWDAFLAAALERIESLKAGRLEAPGVSGPAATAASGSPASGDNGDSDDSNSVAAPSAADIPDKDALTDDGRLVLAPPCKFCSFGSLCGRDWESAQ